MIDIDAIPDTPAARNGQVIPALRALANSAVTKAHAHHGKPMVERYIGMIAAALYAGAVTQDEHEELMAEALTEAQADAALKGCLHLDRAWQ